MRQQEKHEKQGDELKECGFSECSAGSSTKGHFSPLSPKRIINRSITTSLPAVNLPGNMCYIHKCMITRGVMVHDHDGLVGTSVLKSRFGKTGENET